MRVVEFRNVLSGYILPEALQRGVGRQRGSWEASMSRHAAFCALEGHMPRQGSASSALSALEVRMSRQGSARPVARRSINNHRSL